MNITAYFEAKITELQAHLDLKRDAFQTAQDPATRAKIQHEIYFLLGQENAYYAAWMELTNLMSATDEDTLEIPEDETALEDYIQNLQEGYRTCRECGRPLQEDELIYCEDCLVTISAGGTAHTMAEQFRKQQKSNGAKNKKPKSNDNLYL